MSHVLACRLAMFTFKISPLFPWITLCYANDSSNPHVEQKALLRTGFGQIHFTLRTSVRELNIDDFQAR